MKNNYLKILALSFLVASIASCDKEEPTPQPTQPESIIPSISDSGVSVDPTLQPSSTPTDEPTVEPTVEPIPDPIYSEDYRWPFVQEEAYAGTYKFTASSYDEPDSLKLKVDGNWLNSAYAFSRCCNIILHSHWVRFLVFFLISLVIAFISSGNWYMSASISYSDGRSSFTCLVFNSKFLAFSIILKAVLLNFSALCSFKYWITSGEEA